LIQFGLFSWLFAASLQYIPAARAALVLCTQPLLTLAIAAALRRERLTLAKVLGSLIAIGGVAFVLGDHAAAATGTLKGDLLMLGAAVTGSVFNVAAGAYLRKYPAMVLASVMAPVGAAALLIVIAASGEWGGLVGFSSAGWLAIAYLMTLGSAGSFYFWIWALEHTSPSRVAVTVTVNPIAAAGLGALILAEPLTWRLLGGLAAIVSGITVTNWAALAARFSFRNRA
jgi:drug/metabolite transporter (DMT)-like permease